MNPIQRLSARVRSNPGAPLITHIDSTADTRVELSAKTFANWVDKTTSMLSELDVTVGSPVWLEVASERPEHWVCLVWVMACWQYGSEPTLDQGVETELVVQGPRQPEAVPGLTCVACSLHHWGLGFERLPDDVIDYRDVLGEPDVHWSNQLPQNPGLGLEWGDLVSAGSPSRVLASNVDVSSLVKALCEALATGGSLITLTGEAATDELARAERADRILQD